MAAITIKGKEGLYQLVRRGRENTRVRPLNGGETFLVPTDSILEESSSTSEPHSPQQIPEETTPPSEMEETPSEEISPQTEIVLPTETPVSFQIPSSNAPFYVLHYTRSDVKVHEFQVKAEALTFVHTLLTPQSHRFGGCTFKTDAANLYELHGFTLPEMEHAN